MESLENEIMQKAQERAHNQAEEMFEKQRMVILTVIILYHVFPIN